MPQVLTAAAFAAYRADRAPKAMHADAERYTGDADQITMADGLLSWEDGPTAAAEAVPVMAEPDDIHLWVVVTNDVLHAREHCAFGAARAAGTIKHSNLTGGQDAWCGGELMFVDDATIVLNGCSGRYRMMDEAELRAVASAFKASGYGVWSMGWNTDVDRPAKFGTQDPEWVAA